MKPDLLTDPSTLQQLRDLYNNPLVQFYLRARAHPMISKGLADLHGHPRLSWLLYAEIGFALSMLLLRGWRFTKNTSFGGRIWTRVWTFWLYWVGALVAVPWVILGDTYYNLVAGCVDVIASLVRAKGP